MENACRCVLQVMNALPVFLPLGSSRAFSSLLPPLSPRGHPLAVYLQNMTHFSHCTETKLVVDLPFPVCASSLLISTSRLQCALVATSRLLRGIRNRSLTFTSIPHTPVWSVWMGGRTHDQHFLTVTYFLYPDRPGCLLACLVSEGSVENLMQP